ncbi:MAG: DciA family protein [Patescibacteria group bacterium]
MAFTSIRRILPQAIQQAGITRQVTAVRIVEEMQSTLRALWGEERAAFVDVVSFKEGELKLVSRSSSATQELALWSVRLQNELNRRLGSHAVKKIIVRGM